MADGTEVRVRFHGENRDLCLDCAAALGGKRYRLPGKRVGRPCSSCVDMERDSEAEQCRYELEQAALSEVCQ